MVSRIHSSESGEGNVFVLALVLLVWLLFVGALGGRRQR